MRFWPAATCFPNLAPPTSRSTRRCSENGTGAPATQGERNLIRRSVLRVPPTMALALLEHRSRQVGLPRRQMLRLGHRTAPRHYAEFKKGLAEPECPDIRETLVTQVQHVVGF